MFKKIFEYAGPHKKGIYTATAVMLLSVLMGVLPFVLAYQIIAPLVMSDPIGSDGSHSCLCGDVLRGLETGADVLGLCSS